MAPKSCLRHRCHTPARQLGRIVLLVHVACIICRAQGGGKRGPERPCLKRVFRGCAPRVGRRHFCENGSKSGHERERGKKEGSVRVRCPPRAPLRNFSTYLWAVLSADFGAQSPRPKSEEERMKKWSKRDFRRKARDAHHCRTELVFEVSCAVWGEARLNAKTAKRGNCSPYSGRRHFRPGF